MNVLDVNVLLALFRPDHVHHDRAVQWWEASVAAGEAFTVPDIVWVGFFRLVTNRRVYTVPASFDEACEFFDAVNGQDLSLRFTGDARLVPEFLRLGRVSAVRGDLVTDAFIAATAVVYGGSVVTFDRDFRKLDGVRVVEPG